MPDQPVNPNVDPKVVRSFSGWGETYADPDWAREGEFDHAERDRQRKFSSRRYRFQAMGYTRLASQREVAAMLRMLSFGPARLSSVVLVRPRPQLGGLHYVGRDPNRFGGAGRTRFASRVNAFVSNLGAPEFGSAILVFSELSAGRWRTALVKGEVRGRSSVELTTWGTLNTTGVIDIVERAVGAAVTPALSDLHPRSAESACVRLAEAVVAYVSEVAFQAEEADPRGKRLTVVTLDPEQGRYERDRSGMWRRWSPELSTGAGWFNIHPSWSHQLVRNPNLAVAILRELPGFAKQLRAAYPQKAGLLSGSALHMTLAAQMVGFVEHGGAPSPAQWHQVEAASQSLTSGPEPPSVS